MIRQKADKLDRSPARLPHNYTAGPLSQATLDLADLNNPARLYISMMLGHSNSSLDATSRYARLILKKFT
jgi:hypothetical protein